jgi:hypothetical protein
LITALWWQESSQLHALSTEVARLKQDMDARLDASLGTPAATPSAGATNEVGDLKPVRNVPTNALGGGGVQTPKALPTEAKPMVVPVPYGADSLGGSRFELIRQLLDRLVKENHRGVVDIKSFTGRFCLVGNSTDGYSLAPDETPYTKCDVVGNPSDEALSPAQRTPLPFANLVGAVRNSSHGSIEVQSSVGDSSSIVTPYPQVSADLTAGEWNRAGGANNRLEIRIR